MAIAEVSTRKADTLQDLPVHTVLPSKNNPRDLFEEEALESLTQSILLYGVMEPIIVRIRLHDSGVGSHYEILAGERRHRAAKRAGLDTIPAIVKDVDSDADALVMTLIENLQREQLNPIEAARGYQSLTEMGYSQERIVRECGGSVPGVSNTMRLLKLPEKVQEHISAGRLSFSHGKVLLGAMDRIGTLAFTALAHTSAEHGWSVKTLDSEIERVYPRPSPAPTLLDVPPTPETQTAFTSPGPIPPLAPVPPLTREGDSAVMAKAAQSVLDAPNDEETDYDAPLNPNAAEEKRESDAPASTQDADDAGDPAEADADTPGYAPGVPSFDTVPGAVRSEARPASPIISDDTRTADQKPSDAHKAVATPSAPFVHPDFVHADAPHTSPRWSIAEREDFEANLPALKSVQKMLASRPESGVDMDEPNTPYAKALAVITVSIIDTTNTSVVRDALSTCGITPSAWLAEKLTSGYVFGNMDAVGYATAARELSGHSASTLLRFCTECLLRLELDTLPYDQQPVALRFLTPEMPVPAVSESPVGSESPAGEADPGGDFVCGAHRDVRVRTAETKPAGAEPGTVPLADTRRKECGCEGDWTCLICRTEDAAPWMLTPEQYTGHKKNADGYWKNADGTLNLAGMNAWDAHRVIVLDAIRDGHDVPEAVIIAHNDTNYLTGRWKHARDVKAGIPAAWGGHWEAVVPVGTSKDGTGKETVTVVSYADDIEIRSAKGVLNDTGYRHVSKVPASHQSIPPLDYAAQIARFHYDYSRLPQSKQDKRQFEPVFPAPETTDTQTAHAPAAYHPGQRVEVTYSQKDVLGNFLDTPTYHPATVVRDDGEGSPVWVKEDDDPMKFKRQRYQVRPLSETGQTEAEPVSEPADALDPATLCPETNQRCERSCHPEEPCDLKADLEAVEAWEHTRPDGLTTEAVDLEEVLA